MHYQNINTVSDAVKQQLQRIASAFTSVMGENLVGVYLHGSMALECFTEGKSDLDILAVLKTAPARGQTLELARQLLALHNAPCPIEASALYEAQWRPWQHPTPCCFHFSEYWARHIKDRVTGKTDEFCLLDQEFVDADIACHARLTLSRGIALIGPPAKDVIPEVPEADFVDSITRDINEYDFDAYGPENVTSNILILARVWSYLELERILNKREGGEWAVPLLPKRLKPVLRYALADRYEGAKTARPDAAIIEEYRQYVIARIREHMWVSF